MANTWHAILLFLVILLASAKASTPSISSMIGGLSKGRYLNTIQTKNKSPLHPDFENKTYSQTLDHFNYGPESYITFQQKYVINFKYWGGASTSSPIFLYISGESALNVNVARFIEENAPRFKALLVFLEHRYYGESNPFGSKEEAYRNSSTLQYLSSAQALADSAEFIRDLKKNLSAENCPVIAWGGSYGGMLAAWFRLKYPHMVIGALASSAPILYFDDITPQNGYFSVVSKDFRDTSESCYETIKSSWSEIDKIAAKLNGLTTLSRMFNACSPLNNTDELKDALVHLYAQSAQYDDPKRSPVSRICDGIDGEPNGTVVLKRIISGMKAGMKAFLGDFKCLLPVKTSDENRSGWDWQRCTEMVFPISSGGPNSILPEDFPFDFNDFSLWCKEIYNVIPRPHWITTEYGGHNIKKVLERFGSNIIFSNGLRDPYSIGGVLQNISSSIVALFTKKGSHCLDLYSSHPEDPDWLVSQRNEEVKIMEKWIEEYNAK